MGHLKHFSKSSLSRWVMRVVPIFILETHIHVNRSSSRWVTCFKCKNVSMLIIDDWFSFFQEELPNKRHFAGVICKYKKSKARQI